MALQGKQQGNGGPPPSAVSSQSVGAGLVMLATRGSHQADNCPCALGSASVTRSPPSTRLPSSFTQALPPPGIPPSHNLPEQGSQFLALLTTPVTSSGNLPDPSAPCPQHGWQHSPPLAQSSVLPASWQGGCCGWAGGGGSVVLVSSPSRPTAPGRAGAAPGPFLLPQRAWNRAWCCADTRSVCGVALEQSKM